MLCEIFIIIFNQSWVPDSTQFLLKHNIIFNANIELFCVVRAYTRDPGREIETRFQNKSDL